MTDGGGGIGGGSPRRYSHATGQTRQNRQNNDKERDARMVAVGAVMMRGGVRTRWIRLCGAKSVWRDYTRLAAHAIMTAIRTVWY